MCWPDRPHPRRRALSWFLDRSGRWPILGFVLDPEVVEHDGGITASPQPDAGAGTRQAVTLGEDADAAEVHANLAAFLKHLQGVPRVRIELEVVLALDPDAIAVDDAVHRKLLLCEIELR